MYRGLCIKRAKKISFENGQISTFFIVKIAQNEKDLQTIFCQKTKFYKLKAIAKQLQNIESDRQNWVIQSNQVATIL